MWQGHANGSIGLVGVNILGLCFSIRTLRDIGTNVRVLSFLSTLKKYFEFKLQTFNENVDLIEH